ncbi:MAG: SDR family oxidoreductase [Sphaerochaeta sp.]|jgi:pteridine reductase|nr:SDR family oxidoreductase [Sphaerochaeta sp.]MDX9914280.1 SDR family oxidoreductase [Sphaerochaeta sp.]
MGLNREVVLVTGASQRLGAQMVRSLSAAGYAVILHTRRATSEARQLKRDLDEQNLLTSIVEGDLTEVQAINDLFGRALTRYGRIDHLVNNASSFSPLSVEETTVEAFTSLMALHNSAPFFLSKELYIHLKQHNRRGSVINICDATLSAPKSSRPAYYIAKGALLAQTKALAVALGPVVRVNAISPGPILANADDKGYFTRMAERLPVGHTGAASDISRSVKFLLESPFITGIEVVVDGGLRLL